MFYGNEQYKGKKFMLHLMTTKYMVGIHAEIAEAKWKYWSTFSPNPVDVVLAAGEKAKKETSNVYILLMNFFCLLILVNWLVYTDFLLTSLLIFY
jgi:hypothetical protein